MAGVFSCTHWKFPRQRYLPHGDGIQVTSTSGQVSLLVTQVHDLSSLQPNSEGFSTDENVPAIVSVRGNGSTVQGLLDNDHVSNAPNALIDLTGVSNAQHGSVSLNAQAGTVTFTPDANYFGNDAGFDYQISAGPYGQATAHVQVNVNHIDAAPHITGEQDTQIPIYGYNYSLSDDPDRNSAYIVTWTPLYQPGYGFPDPSFNGGYAYHDQPVNYAVDVYSGNVAVTDTDDPASALTWTVVNQAHHGTASVDNNGHWTFSGAQAVGGTDAFVVQVSDPSGKTDQLRITVPLPSPPARPPSDGSDRGAAGDGVRPVILDLNNTGFHFKSVDDSNVFLQSAKDGWRHRTAWFDGGNGVLAFDKYGDGVVHNTSQIAFKDYLPTAQTDLQGLAAFDSNHDGMIDRNDARWSRLGVWVDANQDGVGQAGEFKSLDALGISSISLTSNNQFAVDHGVTIHGTTTFTRADGTTGQAADVILPGSADILAPNADGTTRVTQVATADRAHPMMVGDGNNVVLGDKGDNTISTGAGNNVISTGAGNDLIHVGNGNNTIMSGDGKDMVVTGNGNNTIILGAGPKLVVTGKGDNLVVGGSGNNIILGGNGNNVLYAGTGNSVVYAGKGSNTLLGGVGHNELIAGNGNNTFNDGGGMADMHAGTGSNTFIVTNAKDTITAQQGSGINTVKTSVNWTLGANQQILWGTGHNALTLTGNDLGDQIIGNGAADTLIGGAGNDTLADSGGAARLIGGKGDDTYIVSNAAAVVIEQPGEGNDTIKTSVSYTLPANVEKLVGTGHAALTLTGGAQDGVTLVANDANDTLVAGTGIATLIGGSGNDTFVVNNAADVVQAQAQGNTNTVLTSVSYTAPANVQFLTGTGSGNLTLTGGAQNGETLTANSGNDTLIAGAGIATLVGGSGNDTFVVNNTADKVIAQAGSNTNTILTSVSFTAPSNVQYLTGTGSADIRLTGGSQDGVTITANNGNDTLVAGAGIATLVGGTGNDTFVVNNTADVVQAQAGVNINTIQTSVSYTASANVQNLTGMGSADITLTGNNLSNVITANSGNDTLVAGSGIATLVGGSGNDTFVVNNVADVVRAQAGSNINTVLTSVSYVTPANVRNLTGTGTANLTLTGGSQDGVTITANSGNDTLVAGAGIATLVGGSGNDTFVVNNTADVVQAQAGVNINTIQTSVSYAASANVQNLTGTGSADITLTGNNLSNVITANSGNDTLVAGSGIATLIGGSGNDTFVVNNTADSVIAQAGSNLNTVLTSVSYVTPANVRNLTGTGSDNLTLTGGSQDGVTITANSGNDTLVAGIGVATLVGGSGNDTFVVNNTADTVIAQAGGNINTVLTSVNYVAPANVQYLSGTGSANLTLTGGAQDGITITANSGNDTLVAGSGIATLVGGAGNDTFVVNNVADVVRAPRVRHQNTKIPVFHPLDLNKSTAYV